MGTLFVIIGAFFFGVTLASLFWTFVYWEWTILKGLNR